MHLQRLRRILVTWEQPSGGNIVSLIFWTIIFAVYLRSFLHKFGQVFETVIFWHTFLDTIIIFVFKFWRNIFTNTFFSTNKNQSSLPAYLRISMDLDDAVACKIKCINVDMQYFQEKCGRCKLEKDGFGMHNCVSKETVI